jgi:DeoR family suf operon transcriptional repressor
MRAVPNPMTPGLPSLPAARRSILMFLKKRSEASATELAAELEITVSGVRQHVSGLLADGLVNKRQEVRGPGRPTILYALANAGEALFPRFYPELTNELLAYVEQEDPAMLEHIFERRRRRRERQAKDRLAGKSSFRQRVTELTRILDEDGYLADVTPQRDGSFLVTEHNCAILGVAQRYGLACSTEIEFLRRALPDASIERVAHKLSGAHVCSYEIRPKAKRAAKVRAG